MNNIYDMDLTRTLPQVLKNDPEIMAIAMVIADQLRKVAKQAEETIIFARIDSLPEALLDIIAYDLHVDWYDYEYPVNIKREVIKNSIKIHRQMGTKYAVETALNEIFPGTTVKEWPEFGGAPYTFRIIVNITAAGVSKEKQNDVLDKVKFYKNLRSHLESINYVSIASGKIVTAGACFSSTSIIIYPEE